MQRFKIFIVFFCSVFLATAATLRAQLPTNVDPGDESEAIDAWQNPTYFIPVIIIAVVIIGYGLWKRNKTRN